MKTAKQWAEKTRELLGKGLRYDPLLTTGKSLLEEIIEQIQIDAREGEPDSQQPQPQQ